MNDMKAKNVTIASPVSVFINSENDGRKVTILSAAIAKSCGVAVDQLPKTIVGEIFEVSTGKTLIGPLHVTVSKFGKYYFAGVHFPDEHVIPSPTLYGLMFSDANAITPAPPVIGASTAAPYYVYVGQSRRGLVKPGRTGDISGRLRQHNRNVVEKFTYHAVFETTLEVAILAEAAVKDHFSTRIVDGTSEWMHAGTVASHVEIFLHEFICVKRGGKQLDDDEIGDLL